jgi:hypothetical protein
MSVYNSCYGRTARGGNHGIKHALSDLEVKQGVNQQRGTIADN